MVSYIIFVFAIIALYGIAYADVISEIKGGKQIFMNSKCNSCHSLEIEDIEAKVKKNPAADLSKLDKDYSIEFLVKYLNKEEKLNEKFHPVGFKGDKQNLNELTTWLKSLNNSKCCN